MPDTDKLDVVIENAPMEVLHQVVLQHELHGNGEFGTINLSVTEIRETVHAAEKLLAALGQALEGRPIEDQPTGP